MFVLNRSFVPPVRDEESETQRKAHAKRVRETRRSTQGVTLEELKSAEQLVKKKQQQQQLQQATSQLNSSSPIVEQPVSADSSYRFFRVSRDDNSFIHLIFFSRPTLLRYYRRVRICCVSRHRRKNPRIFQLALPSIRALRQCRCLIRMRTNEDLRGVLGSITAVRCVRVICACWLQFLNSCICANISTSEFLVYPSFFKP